MADLKKKTGKNTNKAAAEETKAANKQSDKRKLEVKAAEKQSSQGPSNIQKGGKNQLIKRNKQDQDKGKDKNIPNKADQAVSTSKIEKVKPSSSTSKIEKVDKTNKANQAVSTSKIEKVKPSSSTSKIEKGLKPAGNKGNAVKQSANKGKGKDKPNNKTNQGAKTTATGKDETKPAAGRVDDHEIGKTEVILEGVRDGLNLVTNILTGGVFPGFT